MEKNNLHKAYIYIIAIFAIGVAISNIISFFHGVGFALIGASILLVLAIANILKDETNKKRFGDVFVFVVLEFLMFIVLFFAYDFNIDGITNKFPMIMRNICAIYSLLATIYVLFRYVSEIKGVKYVFVEYMLGNYTPQPREKKVKPSKAEIKKRKELENGTLAPKPSSIDHIEEEHAEVSNEAIVDEHLETENVDVNTEDADNAEVAEAEEIHDATEVANEYEKASENAPETTTETTPTSNPTVGNRTNFWY